MSGPLRFPPQRGNGQAPAPQLNIDGFNTNAIAQIANATGHDQNFVLNKLILLGKIAIDLLAVAAPIALPLSGVMGAVQAAAPPPKAAEDPNDIDTRTPEERLEALRQAGGIEKKEQPS